MITGWSANQRDQTYDEAVTAAPTSPAQVRPPRPGHRRHLNASMLAGRLTLLVGVLASCTGGGDTGIRTADVGRNDVVEIVEAPAVVTAKASATLTAATNGRVGELPVADGQQVEAGTVIMRIDSPEAQEELRSAQEADAQAAASADVTIPQIPMSQAASQADQQAAAAFAQARQAAEQIPEPNARAHAVSVVSTAEAQYAAARADVDRAIRRLNAGLGSFAEALSSLTAAQRVQTKAAVDVAQRRVDALVVTTPVAGIVTLGSAGGGASAGQGLNLSQLPPSLAGAAEGALSGSTAGDLSGSVAGGAVGALAAGSPVTSGQTVATVTDISTLTLSAEVDETDVLLVKPGVNGSAELDALPGATYDVSVASVDVSPAASTGGGVTYRVRLALGAGKDAQGEIAPVPLPGMSAVVDLRVREANDTLAVPAAAVVRDGTRDSVWLVVDEVARRRYVTLGAQGEAEVEVLTGLQAGDRIVVRGADRVRDGQDLSP
jgi:HlyD family secretion protein